ncbi:MAG TPA: protein kinase, partial [Gemmataceae bacterium]|nr:protein kinase [Gemmataceae bacterium]
MALDTKAVPQHIGDYDILAKIAEGGMGAVYKARHRISGQVVAIKIIPPATAKNPTLLRRFEQEYRTAAVLDHPNIVRAVEFCGTGPSPFLVMEFVDGESVGAKVDREGPMSEDVAVRIIAQVCQGLHRAHKQKMIHRDVKPDNILLTADGTAKLTDLGLVKDADNELNLTKTGRGLGTPNFMAPEQFRNAKYADVRCDIYSLGATLYTMVTGEAPFGKVGPLDCWMRKNRNELTPPKELNPQLSDQVDWAIRRSMSADPERRPASCKEFVEDLMGASLKPPPKAGAPPETDLWYLVYRDEVGETHTVKGTTDAIRRALKDGLLGDASNVRAARTKTGQFLSLSQYAEFRNLVIEPAPLPAPGAVPQAARQTPPPAHRSATTPTPPDRSSRPDPEAVDYAPPRTMTAYDPTTDYRPAGDSTTRPLIPVGRKRRPTPDGPPHV